MIYLTLHHARGFPSFNVQAASLIPLPILLVILEIELGLSCGDFCRGRVLTTLAAETLFESAHETVSPTSGVTRLDR